MARTVFVNAGPWLPVPPSGYGGVETMLAYLIPELRRRGLRVVLGTVGDSRIEVDEHFRTSVEGVYAAGDVIGPPALASVSMEQGRVAVCHAFGFPFKETVDPLPPFAVYSIPEAAMVGLSEGAAQAQGIDHEVGRGWFKGNARATISGFTEGLVKLVFRREDKALLGVHILGEGASELIHTGQAVIHAGGTIDRFIHTTFCAPTRSEAFKYAAYDGLQRLSGRAVDPSPTR